MIENDSYEVAERHDVPLVVEEREHTYLCQGSLHGPQTDPGSCDNCWCHKPSSSSLRSFAEIQREWLDACRDTIVPLELELMLLGNRLLLEAHLSGQHEAYGKVAGGRK